LIEGAAEAAPATAAEAEAEAEAGSDEETEEGAGTAGRAHGSEGRVAGSLYALSTARPASTALSTCQPFAYHFTINSYQCQRRKVEPGRRIIGRRGIRENKKDRNLEGLEGETVARRFGAFQEFGDFLLLHILSFYYHYKSSSF